MGHLRILLRRLIGAPLAIEPQALEALIAYAESRDANGLAVVLPFAGEVQPHQLEAVALAAAGRSRPGLGQRLRAADGYMPGAMAGQQAAGDVAVIPIHGELVSRDVRAQAMSGDFVGYDALAAQVRAAAEDPRVSGIVLDLDSPGGEVHGSFECADAIRAADAIKPVVAYANPYAMSAAYLLASAAGRIVVPTTGEVGSVGVYTAHVDQSAQDAARGLRYTFISAGKGKVEGNSHEPLSDDVRARVQARVDRAYLQFREAVAGYRASLTADQLQELGARRFGAAEAVANGMADEVGNLSRAVELAATPRERPKQNTASAQASARPFPARPRASFPTANRRTPCIGT